LLGRDLVRRRRGARRRDANEAGGERHEPRRRDLDVGKPASLGRRSDPDGADPPLGRPRGRGRDLGRSRASARVMETDRLLLRPPDEGDVAAVYRFVADPKVMRWIGDDGRTGTYDDAVDRIERYRRAWELDGVGHFMVVSKASGEPIGRVGILVWDPRTWEHGTRRELRDAAELELGWTLESAAWGRG